MIEVKNYETPAYGIFLLRDKVKNRTIITISLHKKAIIITIGGKDDKALQNNTQQ